MRGIHKLIPWGLLIWAGIIGLIIWAGWFRGLLLTFGMLMLLSLTFALLGALYEWIKK
jgi:hypothetical protein